MKTYVLTALMLLLSGCNDKIQLSHQQPAPAPQSMQQPMPDTRITPANPVQTQVNPLLAQHIQETNNAPSNNLIQIAAEQSIRAVTDPLQQNLKETMGAELQTVITDFNGQHVMFQYQIWQIRQPSVCSDLKYDIGKFSSCTQSAKALFQQMCGELKQVSSPHHRIEQLQRMYCNAANDFKPTVAQISRSQPADYGADAQIQSLRRVCNDLTFNAMISKKDADIKVRDKACATYKKAANLE